MMPGILDDDAGASILEQWDFPPQVEDVSYGRGARFEWSAFITGGAEVLATPALRSCLIEVYLYGDVADRVVTGMTAAGLELRNPEALQLPDTAQNLIFDRR